MFRWAGRLVRWVVVAAVVVVVVAGGSAAFFGSHRLKNMVYTARRTALENIDSMIPDEVKLRTDLDKLREEYPRRIAELKAMIQSLLDELRDAEKEQRLCAEVVNLCDEDLGRAPSSAGGPSASVVEVPQLAGGQRRLTWASIEAVERTRKIADLRDRYEARLRAGATSLELLAAEQDRLLAELVDLEREYDQFLAEFKAMEREIDVLRTNERLLELAKRRERVDRVDTAGWLRSLTELKRAIAKHRTEQEEKLRSFRVNVPARDYEARAKARVSREEAAADRPAAGIPF
jgi:chromosome segregation ATPase